MTRGALTPKRVEGFTDIPKFPIPIPWKSCLADRELLYH